MSIFMFILPAVAIVLLSLPLVQVFRGKVNKKSAKNRLLVHVSGFFGVIAMVLVAQLVSNNVFAATAADPMVGSIAQGLGYVGAALATGLSALGAGIAVASAAPAAIGAFSENAENFGKSMIFVVLGEGVAIYGLLISILIINAL
ncbi:MAG: ATP synthase subunit C [Coprobacillaceae bacterium]